MHELFLVHQAAIFAFFDPPGGCALLWPESSSSVSGLTSSSFARSCLAAAPQHSIGINLTVQCPKSMVGRVIGKGGETIKGLQRKYHTSIQVGSQVRITNRGGGPGWTGQWW